MLHCVDILSAFAYLTHHQWCGCYFTA